MTSYAKALAQLVKKQKEDWLVVDRRFVDQIAKITNQHEEARRFHDRVSTYQYWELKEKYHLPLGRAARAALADPGVFHRRGQR